MALKINPAHGPPKASTWIARMKEAAAAKSATTPPAANGLSGLARIVRQIREAKPKKPKLSVVEAKKAAKLLEALGKTVTGIHVASDGSFTVNAADLVADPQMASAGSSNPWDEVLPQ